MDEDLCTALKEQLNNAASKDFNKGKSNGSAAVRGERLPQKGALQRGAEALTAEEYVARTLPLLELEREAEVAQVRGASVSMPLLVVSINTKSRGACSSACNSAGKKKYLV